MHCKLLLSPQAERLTRSNSRSHSLVLSIQPKPYFWADTPPDVRWEDSYTGYAHVSRLLRRRELRPSILLREPDEDLFGRDHSSGLSATLQRCDGTVLHVRSRNTRAVYLVLLQGRLQMMLIRDVFSRTFTGYLCFRYTEDWLTLVDNELQHRSLSIIVGRVNYTIYSGNDLFLEARFAQDKQVPPLQGEDNIMTSLYEPRGSLESSSQEF